ncbi:MAG: hypothetical protein AB3N06_04075 [Erythrobacter sp.]
MHRLAPPIAALLALSACSANEQQEPVEAVTQSEAQALDDAAEMIEQRRLPEDLLPPEDDGAVVAPRESGGPEPMELPQ